MAILEFLTALAPYVGTVAGAFGHMVKKKKEVNGGSGLDEIQIIANMLKKRPLTTLASVATTLAGVAALTVPEAHPVHQFITAFAIAWASDSAVNRVG